jgi:hypothetical protein
MIEDLAYSIIRYSVHIFINVVCMVGRSHILSPRQHKVFFDKWGVEIMQVACYNKNRSHERKVNHVSPENTTAIYWIKQRTTRFNTLI